MKNLILITALVIFANVSNAAKPFEAEYKKEIKPSPNKTTLLAEDFNKPIVVKPTTSPYNTLTGFRYDFKNGNSQFFLSTKTNQAAKIVNHNGEQVFEIVDSLRENHPTFPVFYQTLYNEKIITSGTIEVSFDLKTLSNTPDRFQFELRDSTKTTKKYGIRRTFLSFSCSNSYGYFNGRRVPIAANQFNHYKFTVPLNKDNVNITMKRINQKGQVSTIQHPIIDKIEAFNSIVFYLPNKGSGKYWIDNLVINHIK